MPANAAVARAENIRDRVLDTLRMLISRRRAARLAETRWRPEALGVTENLLLTSSAARVRPYVLMRRWAR